MISALKAEIRKLLTVRSTYVATGIALAIVIFYAFYIVGYHNGATSARDVGQLSDDVTGAIQAVILFAEVVAILLMTHEYRYSTIMYTLTSSNSRSKTLIAKIVSVMLYTTLFTLVVGVLAPSMALLGMHAHHLTVVPQTIHYGDLLWKILVFGIERSLFALLFAVLIRNQVGAIAAVFVVPGVVEQLLALLFKNGQVYLPFTALDMVIGARSDLVGKLTPVKAAFVASTYLVAGWIIAWILFLKRDATS